MHYVRFLRQPSLTTHPRRQELSLVLLVTSDLGDRLLSPDKPLTLSVCLFKEGHVASRTVSFAAKLAWKPGARVVKERIAVPEAEWRQVVVTATGALSAGQFATLACPKGGDARNPLVMPAWFDFKTGNRPAGTTDVCLRKLTLADPVRIEFEEEFGDSIARHVWDGGLAAVSYLTKIYQGSEWAAQMMPTVSSLLRRGGSRPLNILELGCGVGVLGIGLAGLLSLTTDPDVLPECHLLMTDVPDAEERALANIGLFRDAQAKEGRAVPEIVYENLDWEEGREGRFSEAVGSRRWDLVVLSDCTYNIDTIPSLVGTLSQLRKTTARHGGAPLRVFLATKPRHSSEQAVFDILGSEGWAVKERAVVELHGLPDETEEVEFYLLAME